jgi:hypothetical protein
MNLVLDAHRLALMNARLHGIVGRLKLGDRLSPDAALPKVEVILTRPPLGSKEGGGLPCYGPGLSFGPWTAASRPPGSLKCAPARPRNWPGC